MCRSWSKLTHGQWVCYFGTNYACTSAATLNPNHVSSEKSSVVPSVKAILNTRTYMQTIMKSMAQNMLYKLLYYAYASLVTQELPDPATLSSTSSGTAPALA
jgi:hypothetical protein